MRGRHIGKLKMVLVMVLHCGAAGEKAFYEPQVCMVQEHLWLAVVHDATKRRRVGSKVRDERFGLMFPWPFAVVHRWCRTEQLSVESWCVDEC